MFISIHISHFLTECLLPTVWDMNETEACFYISTYLDYPYKRRIQSTALFEIIELFLDSVCEYSNFQNIVAKILFHKLCWHKSDDVTS